MESLRILVLGDEQVGKTSIIRCFLTQSFPLEVPACNPVVSIPSDLSQNQSSLKIIDTYCNPYSVRKGQDMDSLQKEILRVQIILLVFDVTRPETLKRVSSFWLPIIEKIRQVPCLLVGNKIDLPKHSKDLEDIGKDIRSCFPFCQIMIETSAMSFSSICKIFEIAEQAVRFPIQALYDPGTLELTEKFLRALKMIFRVCDLDGDFRLNDDEMNFLNRSVFGIDLNHRELDKIKLLVKENTTDGLDYSGITFSGFIAIHKIFIKKLKSENCWKILNHFKFDEKLERNIEVLITQPEDSVIELSRESVDFLSMIFKRHSSHSMLSPSGVDEICSTMTSFPWSPSNYWDLVHSIDRSLSIYSWLALWHLLMHSDPINTVKSLLMIGFNIDYRKTFRLLKRKDLQNRRVHFSLILGNAGVGKKLLIKKFLQKDLKESVENLVCGSIEETEDLFESSFLVLSKKEGLVPDVFCLVYDGSGAAINFIKKLNLGESTPRILMLNKNDSIDHESAYSFALEIGLKECPQFNLRVQRPNTLFKQLKDYAANPTRAPARRAKVKNKPKKQANGLKWLFGGLVLMGALVLGNRSLKIFR